MGLRLRCLAWGSAAALLASGCMAVDAIALGVTVTVPSVGGVEATVPSVTVPTVPGPSVTTPTVPSLPLPPSATVPTPVPPAPTVPVPDLPTPSEPSAPTPSEPPAPTLPSAQSSAPSVLAPTSAAPAPSRSSAVVRSTTGTRRHRAGRPAPAPPTHAGLRHGPVARPVAGSPGATGAAGMVADATARRPRPRFGVGGVVAHGNGKDGGGHSGLGLPPPIGNGGEATLLVGLGLLVALTLLVRRELLRQR
jgi:type IV secretory pathway VirB10-like protein